MNAETTIVIHFLTQGHKKNSASLGRPSSTIKGQTMKARIQEHKDIVGISYVR